MNISERSPQSSPSAPPSVAPGSFPNAAYWLIVGNAATDTPSRGSRNRRTATIEVLLADRIEGGAESGAEGRILPVFGSEESAALFARAWIANAATMDGVEGLWRPRGTGAGELISLLSGSAFSAGPCGGVERVTLDPPPELADGIRHGPTEGRVGELLTMSRACFLERLMGRGRSWFENRDQVEPL